MAEFEAQKDGATASLDILKNSRMDLKELKAFVRPPPVVQLVMNAVLVVFGEEPNWKNAQHLLGSPTLLQTLEGLDINTLKASTMKKLTVYVKNKELSVEAVDKASKAAACLWTWVLSVYNTYMEIATTIWANQRSVLSSDATTIKKRRKKLIKKRPKAKAEVQREAEREKLEEGLDRNALMELKAFVRPPSYVLLVMEAVSTVFGVEPNWKNAQHLLGSPTFVKKLKELDVSTLKASTMKKLAVYVQNEKLSVEAVNKASRAAAWLWGWVLGVYEAYMEIAKAIWANQRSMLSSDAAAVAESTSKTAATTSTSTSVVIKKKKKKCKKRRKAKTLTEGQILGKSLNRNALMELKTFVRPTPIIQLVVEAALTMLEEEPTWSNAQRLLGSPTFLKKLKELNINTLNENTMERLAIYVHHPALAIAAVRKASLAAAVLWQWLVGVSEAYDKLGDGDEEQGV